MRVSDDQARAEANRISEVLGDALNDEVEGWLISRDDEEDDPGVILRAVSFARLELIDEDHEVLWGLMEPTVGDESIWPLLQALTPFTPPGGPGWGSVSIAGGDQIPSGDQVLWEGNQ